MIDQERANRIAKMISEQIDAPVKAVLKANEVEFVVKHGDSSLAHVIQFPSHKDFEKIHADEAGKFLGDILKTWKEKGL